MTRRLLIFSALAALCLAGAYLWWRARVSARDAALLAAAEAGDVELARRLLDAGANPSARRLPPRGPAEALRDLLHCSSVGTSAFELAVWNRHWSIAELLLERGAEVGGDTGAAALHDAAALGRPRLLALLLDRGVPVDAPDWDNRPALILAVWNRQPEAAEVLLRRGADLQRLLVTHPRSMSFNGQPTRGIDHFLSGWGWDGPTVCLLVRHGLPADLRLHGGQPLLVAAVLAGDRDATRFLLDRGADVEAADGLGWPALYYADIQSKREIAVLLEQRGAKRRW